MNLNQKRNHYYFALALTFSAILHIGLLSFRINFHQALDKTKGKSPEKIIKVILLDEEKKNISKQSIDEKKKQIVNTEQQSPTESAVDSRFLGKSNQIFDRQTVAKHIASFKEAGFGFKEGADQPSEKIEPSVTSMKPPVNKVGERSKRNKLSLKDLLVNSEMTKEMFQTPKPNIKGSESGDKQKKGPATNNDFVEDIKLGDFTRLNTTEYKYFGFYDRIRKRLEQFWGNSLQEKAKKFHARGGRLPAGENKITSLKVTIDIKGNITNVQIKGTSGIMELDEAAVESFNKAGPFPNPPQGMMVNGQAEIEWGFVVKS